MRAATLTNYDAEKRTARLSFASETPVKDYWYGKEILRVTEDSLVTERFKAGVMPVLFNHDRDKVIARVDNISIENNVAYADITFDDDDFSESIKAKVESGSLRGVSVGYEIQAYTIVERNTNVDGVEGPALIATKWEAFEISIVSIPADSSVGVGRSRLYDAELFRELETEPIEEPEEEIEVEVTPPQEEGEEEQVMNEQERQLELQQAREAEMNRQRSIREMCATHGISADDMNSMLNDGNCSIETANERALQILAERNKPTSTPKVEVGEQEADKKRAAMVDGLLMRHGVMVEKPAAGAENFRGKRFVEIARMTLNDAGVRGVDSMDDRELLRRALTTTDALSVIADNIAHKSMSKGYAAAGTTYKQWTTVGSNSDFKVAKRYRLYDAMAPVMIPEGGEFTYGELKDEHASVQLATYGKALNFTREMMINDDLSVLTQTVPLFYASMERYKNQMVYKALATAKNYSTANGNLGTAAELSVASLSEAKKLMRKQKLGDNTLLNITPGFLIVPAALEEVAERLIFSAADPEGINSGVYNPFRNKLQLIVDATLDSVGDEKAYYLVAGKGQVDTIEVSYLNGVETPIIETGVDFNHLGVNFRMFHDFSINVLDTRGLVKNAGV